MRTYQGLYDEFAAALQFPSYFGENAAAFDECIGDLDEWLLTSVGYVILIVEPEQVLAETSDDGLGFLVESLADAREKLEPAVEGQGDWNRGPLGFHVVLHTAKEKAHEVERRWRAAQDVVDEVTVDVPGARFTPLVCRGEPVRVSRRYPPWPARDLGPGAPTGTPSARCRGRPCPGLGGRPTPTRPGPGRLGVR